MFKLLGELSHNTLQPSSISIDLFVNFFFYNGEKSPKNTKSHRYYKTKILLFGHKVAEIKFLDDTTIGIISRYSPDR